MVDFRKIRQQLFNKSLDAMMYLDIPDSPQLGDFGAINKQSLFQRISSLNQNSEKVAMEHHWHCMRLGIYSVLVMDYLGVNEEDEEGEEEATLPSSFVEGPINQVRMGGMLPQLVKEDTEKIEDNSGADIISETLADNPTNKLVG